MWAHIPPRIGAFGGRPRPYTRYSQQFSQGTAALQPVITSTAAICFVAANYSVALQRHARADARLCDVERGEYSLGVGVEHFAHGLDLVRVELGSRVASQYRHGARNFAVNVTRVGRYQHLRRVTIPPPPHATPGHRVSIYCRRYDTIRYDTRCYFNVS